MKNKGGGSLRVVLDTNVLISAILWDGSVAQKMLYNFIERDVEIFSSVAALQEFQNVLKRDFDYNADAVEQITEILFTFIKLIEPNEKLEVVKDDPDDNKILECAIASSSDYIISYDKHLTSIDTFRGIKIIRPNDALRLF
ncbi:MAG: putative toxin-antitoxin system toxin component, PIN family [DPANN group archaeon]|nr:putative toxin-antitoxin system toxin component, PIN family [DPANN group archaeon]